MSVNIKGARIPALVVKVDAHLSVEENLTEIEQHLKSNLFTNKRAILDLGESDIPSRDTTKFENLFRAYNSRLLAVAAPSRDTVKKTSKTERRCKLRQQNLRSGQCLEFDGDIVILGNVNPDAVVKANGNILVFGSLRGTVYAGASGDHTALIMATDMRPQRLTIANIQNTTKRFSARSKKEMLKASCIDDAIIFE